ncbi:MAG TPA: hypothetical protein VLA77_00595 [Candidatus Saccharimonadales bacterium]|nr:hypothetical protein [Candidatus Saccharimonadales bacterium]
MNEDQHLQTPVSGDDDLAKALSDQSGMKFEETPMPSMITDDSASQPPAPQVSEPEKDEEVETPAPSSWSPGADSNDTKDEPETPAVTSHSSTSDDSLDKIKDDVVNAIKPLLGKLDLPPEEKFDTMLLVIRSTDDQSLLQATFNAAKEIPDEAKRAKALLDVMREVSYFSGKK